MRIKDLQKKIHKMAKEKGWWETPRSPLEVHALIHSEIAEATEEVRNNKESIYVENGKPEGEAVELVDAFIRMLDWFEYNGWDFEKILKMKMKYNATRPYRHGGKKY